MEYLPLSDLSTYNSGEITEIDAKCICVKLLGGLEVMHEKAFTHRDLKLQIRVI